VIKQREKERNVQDAVKVYSCPTIKIDTVVVSVDLPNSFNN